MMRLLDPTSTVVLQHTQWSLFPSTTLNSSHSSRYKNTSFWMIHIYQQQLVLHTINDRKQQQTSHSSDCRHKWIPVRYTISAQALNSLIFIASAKVTMEGAASRLKSWTVSASSQIFAPTLDKQLPQSWRVPGELGVKKDECIRQLSR